MDGGGGNKDQLFEVSGAVVVVVMHYLSNRDWLEDAATCRRPRELHSSKQHGMKVDYPA